MFLMFPARPAKQVSPVFCIASIFSRADATFELMESEAFRSLL